MKDFKYLDFRVRCAQSDSERLSRKVNDNHWIWTLLLYGLVGTFCGYAFYLWITQ